ncbi:MAG: ABC transporter permease [Alphaproteobacteria bacterium]
MRVLVLALQWGVVATLAALWETASQQKWVDPQLLPPLSKVLSTLQTMLGNASFQRDMLTTLGEVAAAFALVAPIGIGFGFFLGERRKLYKAVAPSIHLILAIPKSIFLPIFIMGLGIGFGQKVAFAVALAVFIVLINAIAAVHSVPQGLITAARAMGATPRQIYLRIYIPAMLPLIIGGLRMGLIFTVTGVLLAEMYAAQRGIGRAIFAWGESYQMAQLLAAVLLVVTVTIVFNELLQLCESYTRRRTGSRMG